jgi:hypothetical protein
MKHISVLTALVLLMFNLIVFPSCKKDKDKTPPVIELYGAATVIVCSNTGGIYNEPGYKATDDVDGDITSKVVVTNPVNPTVDGTYTIRYNVSDEAGNNATEVVRTVKVMGC